jgi:hypothetical protein
VFKLFENFVLQLKFTNFFKLPLFRSPTFVTHSLDLERNNILREIELTTRKDWKKVSNYHRRSLSETAMMRFKTIFGPTLYSRIFEKQKTEAAIKIKCLNKMTALGMPISQKYVA